MANRVNDYIITMIDGVWHCKTKIMSAYITAVATSPELALKNAKKKINEFMIKNEKK